MYTANIIEIDGLTVITGIDKKGIDQVETEKKIAPYLQESSEIKAIDAKNNQIKAYVKNIEAITNQEKQLLFVVSSEKGIPVNLIKDEHLTFNQRESFQRFKEKKDFNRKQAEILQQDLPALNEKKNAKRLALILQHAVYFQTPGGQIDLSESQAYEFNKKLCAAVEYFNSTKKRRVLLLTGEVIDDLCGQIAWIKSDKWYKRQLQFLTDKLDTTEILQDDLDDDQKKEIAAQEEAERILNLTQEQREAETAQRIDALLSQAAAMRSKLEIQGDAGALEKTKAWYQEQIFALQK